MENTQITITKSISVSEVLLENDDNAKEIFKNLKNNLFNTNHWNEMKNSEFVDFQICDKNGKEKVGFIENDDLIRICVSDKDKNIKCHDWMKIEGLEEKNFTDEQIITFVLIPIISSELVDNRLNKIQKSEFFNSFSIRRLRNKIITEIEETNEMINWEAINLYHKIRNLFMGFNGIINLKAN